MEAIEINLPVFHALPMIKQGPRTRAEKASGQSPVNCTTDSLLKCGVIGFGKGQRVDRSAVIEVHRCAQDAVPAQDLEKLAGHEGAKVDDRLVFDLDVFRLGSWKN